MDPVGFQGKCFLAVVPNMLHCGMLFLHVFLLVLGQFFPCCVIFLVFILVVLRIFAMVAVLYLSGAVVCRGPWWSLACLVFLRALSLLLHT
jgi:hypothetical protein